ncbi:tripartite tricarboxylate transporter substrate binding protein [Bradyrhizobium hipponense]|uniref:Tripartite tricarboxylate transporter substrate binding protein n=1 Tax=Bradyrhizobium hipponense TaxID=2605638 RepID=A0A5S4YLI9_9BRAD|nr:tripartite tricarboxylate transporter substrate-binding protein [Bradyrhizobium hipponense]TYO64998.1 tripartite tricarboxylate transporter substrate binding protein [Bradyrhizobium hipponense]
MKRRDFLLLTAGAGIAPVGFSPSMAAVDYPAKPVRVMVGFPANGPVDIAGRVVSEWLTERLGQHFAVENKPGESGNTATREVVRAAADGYTLLIFGPVNTINTTLFGDLDFDFGRDILPIAGLYRVPLVVEVNPSVPVNSAAELLTYARQNPGKLKVGYGGKGTPQHIGIELFKWMAKVDMKLTAFTGSVPALQALQAGKVDVMFDPLPSSIGLIRDNKLRPLAVTTLVRSPVLPDVPSMSEHVPGYEAGSWFGLGAPRETPAEVVAKLDAAVGEGLATTRIRLRIESLGGTPLLLSQRELAQFVTAETERFSLVIKAAGIGR